MSQKNLRVKILFFLSCQKKQMVYYLDEMYAEVCAYLTSHKYFELPNYRVRIFVFLS
jgi:hypothetical protein